MLNRIRGGSRAAVISMMELFVITVNDWKPLTIITRRSIFDVAAALDPPLRILHRIIIYYHLICERISLEESSYIRCQGTFIIPDFEVPDTICDFA